MQIQAIQTVYDGHRFRSRMEARWAVFFDHMFIKYHYELEGYNLPSGRYLPDFYLPNFERGCFAEVKPKFSVEEKMKCQELCDLAKKPVLLLEGPPDFMCYIYLDPEHPRTAEEYLYGILNNRNKYGERMYVYPGFEKNDLSFLPTDWDEKYASAVMLSRSARFEFGENGK